MLLKVNKAVVWFLVICFIAMIIPYLWDFGSRSLFLRDFYAKRIMTLLSFPFFLFIIFLALRKGKIKLNKHIIGYSIILAIVLFNSLLFRNSLQLIVLDMFVAMLPLFFYLLVYKTDFNSRVFSKYFPFFLLISCILVLLKIKLQFSYFSMLGIVYLIFLTRNNAKSYLLLLFLPALTINTLIGKSALLMLIFMAFYFFIFDKKLVSTQKKIYLALIPSVLTVVFTIIFWSSIKKTGAYTNTTYFLRHTNFTELKFNDMSTGHRLYEAKRVLEEYQRSNYYIKLLGKGYGATIDLSETTDVSVTKANSDLSKVRHIHIGFFAVLYRYGLIGVVVYFIFLIKMIKSCRIVLRNSSDYALVLSSLYVLIMLFDSFISFPHMMSNFIFWLISFIIFRESEKIKLKKQNDLPEIRPLQNS